jgi:hypothetical protein
MKQERDTITNWQKNSVFIPELALRVLGLCEPPVDQTRSQRTLVVPSIALACASNNHRA